MDTDVIKLVQGLQTFTHLLLPVKQTAKIYDFVRVAYAEGDTGDTNLDLRITCRRCSLLRCHLPLEEGKGVTRLPQEGDVTSDRESNFIFNDIAYAVKAIQYIFIGKAYYI